MPNKPIRTFHSLKEVRRILGRGVLLTIRPLGLVSGGIARSDEPGFSYGVLISDWQPNDRSWRITWMHELLHIHNGHFTERRTWDVNYVEPRIERYACRLVDRNPAFVSQTLREFCEHRRSGLRLYDRETGEYIRCLNFCMMPEWAG